MVMTLIRKQLLELFHTYIVDAKTGKARSKAGLIMYLLMALAIFGGLGIIFFGMGKNLGEIMLNAGFNWLYFALMSLLAIALGTFGSVFNTYASLYLPRDNEFLTALPFTPMQILLARTAGVYAISLMYSAWIWIPITLAYWACVPLTAANIICPAVMTFVIALFVTVLSCVLGWLVAVLSSMTKGKSFFTVALSLMFIGAYYFVYFRIVRFLGELVLYLDQIETMIRSWLGFIYWIGIAADGSLVMMAVIIAVTCALMALCLWLMSRNFFRVSSRSHVHHAEQKKESYQENDVKKSLLMRELKHFTSSPTWMLNSGLGILLMPVIAGTFLVKAESFRPYIEMIRTEIPMLYEILPVFVFGIVAVGLSMSPISASSISLEGKNIWILQTMPVEMNEILRAKENVHGYLLSIPALIEAAVLSVVIGFDALHTVLIICAVWVTVWMIADLGLVLNLRHPNLSWTNESSPVKQSLPVYVILLGGMLVYVLVMVAAYYLSSINHISVILLGGVIVISAGFRAYLKKWMKTKGARILKTL